MKILDSNEKKSEGDLKESANPLDTFVNQIQESLSLDVTIMLNLLQVASYIAKGDNLKDQALSSLNQAIELAEKATSFSITNAYKTQLMILRKKMYDVKQAIEAI